MTLVFLTKCASVDDGEVWLNIEHITAIHRAMVPTSETTEVEGVMVQTVDQRFFLFLQTLDDVVDAIERVGGTIAAQP